MTSGISFVSFVQEQGQYLSHASHNCPEDHVSQWQAQRKTFDMDGCFGSTVVTLSFAPCPINPARTLVLDASYVTIAWIEKVRRACLSDQTRTACIICFDWHNVQDPISKQSCGQQQRQ